MHRFAARLACNDFQLPYMALLLHLKWKPLSQVITERQLCTVHKWAHDVRWIPDGVLGPRPPPPRQLRRAARNYSEHQIIVRNDMFSSRKVVPRRNTDQTPLHNALVAWNTLPESTAFLGYKDFRKEIQNRNTFIHIVENSSNQYSGHKCPLLSAVYQSL